MYTCSTSDGVLSWNVGGTVLGSYVANLDDPGETWTRHLSLVFPVKMMGCCYACG